MKTVLTFTENNNKAAGNLQRPEERLAINLLTVIPPTECVKPVV